MCAADNIIELSADNPWKETNNLMFERQKLRKLLRKAAA